MVVRYHLYFLPPYERPKLLNRPDKSNAFLLRYQIVDFRFAQQSTGIREDTLLPIVLLHKDSSYPVMTSVTMNFHWEVVSWVG